MNFGSRSRNHVSFQKPIPEPFRTSASCCHGGCRIITGIARPGHVGCSGCCLCCPCPGLCREGWLERFRTGSAQASPGWPDPWLLGGRDQGKGRSSCWSKVHPLEPDAEKAQYRFLCDLHPDRWARCGAEHRSAIQANMRLALQTAAPYRRRGAVLQECPTMRRSLLAAPDQCTPSGNKSLKVRSHRLPPDFGNGR